MTDREKVIKGLEHSARVWDGRKAAVVDMDVLTDAVDLLKTQEPVEPIIAGRSGYDGNGSWWYECGECKRPIDYKDRFCRWCGMAVSWSEST